MRVSRAKATYRSGPNKGRLKPGCRFIKGDGADCNPPGKRSRKGKKRKVRAKKIRSRKRSSSRSRRKGMLPNTPAMNTLNAIRRRWKSARTCNEKRAALRELRQQFHRMANKPARRRKGESQSDAARRRWKRWKKEYGNKLHMTGEFCTGRKMSRAPFEPVMVDGVESSKHPCARKNPPSWCRR